MGLIHPVPSLHWKKTTWDELEIKFASLCVLKARIKRMSLLSVENQESLDNDELESLYYSMLGDKRVGQKTGDAQAVVEFFPREDLPDELAGEVTVKQAVYDCGLFYTSHRPFTGDRITGLWNNPWLAFSPGDVVLILYQPKSTAETPPAGRELYKRLILVGHSAYEGDNEFKIPAFCGVDNVFVCFEQEGSSNYYYFVVNDGYIRKLDLGKVPPLFPNKFIYKIRLTKIFDKEFDRHFFYKYGLEVIICERVEFYYGNSNYDIHYYAGCCYSVSFPRMFSRRDVFGVYGLYNELALHPENLYGTYSFQSIINYNERGIQFRPCSFIKTIKISEGVDNSVNIDLLFLPTYVDCLESDEQFLSELTAPLTVNDFGEVVCNNLIGNYAYLEPHYTTGQRNKRESLLKTKYDTNCDRTIVTSTFKSDHDPVLDIPFDENVQSVRIDLEYSRQRGSAGYRDNVHHVVENGTETCSVQHEAEKHDQISEFEQKATVTLCHNTPYQEKLTIESTSLLKREYFDSLTAWPMKKIQNQQHSKNLTFIHFDVINDLYVWVEAERDDNVVASRSSNNVRFNVNVPTYLPYWSPGYEAVDVYKILPIAFKMYLKIKDKKYLLEECSLYFSNILFGHYENYLFYQTSKAGVYALDGWHQYKLNCGYDYRYGVNDPKHLGSGGTTNDDTEIITCCDNDLTRTKGEITVTREQSFFGLNYLHATGLYDYSCRLKGTTYYGGIPFCLRCDFLSTGERDFFIKIPKISYLLGSNYWTDLPNCSNDPPGDTRVVQSINDHPPTYPYWQILLNNKQGIITKELDQITFDVNGNYKI
jgi:hypothetical protein